MLLYNQLLRRNVSFIINKTLSDTPKLLIETMPKTELFYAKREKYSFWEARTEGTLEVALLDVFLPDIQKGNLVI